MIWPTLRAVRAEKAMRKHPHKILPVYRHAPLCLVSNGTIIPKYRCTCGAPVLVGYTLQWGASS